MGQAEDFERMVARGAPVNETVYVRTPAEQRAMHAAAPKGEPRYDGGPDHLAALARERDGWRNEHQALGSRLNGVIGNLEAENTRLHDALKVRTDEKEAMQSMIDMLSDRCQLWADEVARLRAAQRPAPAVPDTPKPAHDFTRWAKPRDPRRLGNT